MKRLSLACMPLTLTISIISYENIIFYLHLLFQKLSKSIIKALIVFITDCRHA